MLSVLTKKPPLAFWVEFYIWSKISLQFNWKLIEFVLKILYLISTNYNITVKHFISSTTICKITVLFYKKDLTNKYVLNTWFCLNNIENNYLLSFIMWVNKHPIKLFKSLALNICRVQFMHEHPSRWDEYDSSSFTPIETLQVIKQ